MNNFANGFTANERARPDSSKPNRVSPLPLPPSCETAKLSLFLWAGKPKSQIGFSDSARSYRLRITIKIEHRTSKTLHELVDYAFKLRTRQGFMGSKL